MPVSNQAKAAGGVIYPVTPVDFSVPQYTDVKGKRDSFMRSLTVPVQANSRLAYLGPKMPLNMTRGQMIIPIMISMGFFDQTASNQTLLIQSAEMVLRDNLDIDLFNWQAPFALGVPITGTPLTSTGFLMPLPPPLRWDDFSDINQGRGLMMQATTTASFAGLQAIASIANTDTQIHILTFGFNALYQLMAVR